jgi:hypothetical protein
VGQRIIAAGGNGLQKGCPHCRSGGIPTYPYEDLHIHYSNDRCRSFQPPIKSHVNTSQFERVILTASGHSSYLRDDFAIQMRHSAIVRNGPCTFLMRNSEPTQQLILPSCLVSVGTTNADGSSPFNIDFSSNLSCSRSLSSADVSRRISAVLRQQLVRIMLQVADKESSFEGSCMGSPLRAPVTRSCPNVW